MKRFWLVCWCLWMCGGSWADPNEVRRALVAAFEQNQALQRACLDNLTHQGSVGYRAYDILGVVEDRATGQTRPHLRLRMTQGPLKETRSPWDLAIDGTGFFALSDGRLTRTGAFTVDNQGRLLVAPGGAALLVQGSDPAHPTEVRVPDNASNIKIGSDGRVTGTRMNSDGQEEQLAQVLLASVRRPELLVRQGDGLAVTAESGPAVFHLPGTEGLGILSQGYLELSNTNLLEDLETAAALRAYAGLLLNPDAPRK